MLTHLSAGAQLKRLLDSLPLPDERIAEAEAFIKECTEAELAELGLGPPPRPAVPRFLQDAKGANPQQRLQAVQNVINSLQYNHTPGYYYNVCKDRPFSRIMDTAREVLRAALPIKCLEAVFLGALLTAGWSDLDRLPLAFKSTVQGNTYRHIVLVVFHHPIRKWGAVGLSRRPELMDKELVYDSLAELVLDYKKSYERWWHTLVRVYVGLPLEHDSTDSGPVCWRYLTLSISSRKPWSAHQTSLDTFAGQARKLAAKFRALGGKPSSNDSLGGPEAASSGTAAGARTEGPPPPSLGPAERISSLTALSRAARSVSPARRRPPSLPLVPSPPPRRPITTSRTRATAGSSAAAATPRATAPTTAASTDSPKRSPYLTSHGGALGSSHGGAGKSVGGSTIVAVSKAVATPVTPPTNTTSGAAAEAGQHGGGVYETAAMEAVAAAAAATAAETISRVGSESGSSGSGDRTTDGGVRQQGNLRILLLRRSSDPGSVSLAAAGGRPDTASTGGCGVGEASSNGHDAKSHARVLRQSVREEEGRVGAGVVGVYLAPDGEEAAGAGDEDEDSDSDVGEYLSDCSEEGEGTAL